MAPKLPDLVCRAETAVDSVACPVAFNFGSMSSERDLEAPLLNGAEAAEGEENCSEAVIGYERAVHVKAGECVDGEPTEEGAL